MFWNWLKRLKCKLELRMYDDFSIEDYFRKQGAQVGKNNRILVRSLGESPALVSIGDHCTIGGEVLFLTHDGAGWIFTDELPDLQKFGMIQIMDNCFIGARSILLPNICIGPNAVIGAGSVVTKDVLPGRVAAGNPARDIGSVDALKKKMIHIWKAQRPPGYLHELHKGKVYSAKTIQKLKQKEKKRLEKYLVEFFRK